MNATSLQTSVEAESTPTVALEPHQNSNDLTQALQVLELIRDGKTVQEAGHALGISRSTAFRRLSLIEEDVDRGVVKLLSAKGLDFAENWVTAAQVAAEKGDHRPAKDALLYSRQVDPIVDGSSGTNIAIIIGTQEQPIRIAPPQAVVVEAVGSREGE